MLAAALGLLLSACSQGAGGASATTAGAATSTATAATTAATEAAPAAGPSGSVTTVMTKIGNTLDPAVANSTTVSSITSHIYDKVVGVDETFNFVPGVAGDWTEVDGVTWELTIMDGFVFHNGEPLELEDVKYSIDRLESITQAAESYSNIESVEIQAPDKIILHYKEPNSVTFRDLMSNVVVVNKSYCEEAGEKYANEPVGTGPYVLSKFTPGSDVVLSAWDAYPFDAPKIETLAFKSIEEDASRYIAVETGEAEVAQIVYQDLQRAQDNASVEVYETRTSNTGFISMNTAKPPFDNANVRRAIAHATDKEGLAIIKGGSEPINSMVPSMLDIYYDSPNLPNFDLDKAKELLAAEGYGEGSPLEFTVWIYSGSDPVVEALQADLKTIGVNMEISSMEFGVFLDGMANGEYEMLLGSWNNVSGNNLSALANYWTGSFGVENISFYDNPRCDELYSKAVTASGDELIEIAREVQDIAAQDVPMIPTFSQISYVAAAKGIQNIRLYMGGTISLRDAYIEP
jgi:peptide/nickel transport system substrate-binding protein